MHGNIKRIRLLLFLLWKDKLMKLEDWPDCPVKGCKSKICIWANTNLCHPHSVELWGDDLIQFMYEATHNDWGLISSIEGINDD